MVDNLTFSEEVVRHYIGRRSVSAPLPSTAFVSGPASTFRPVLKMAAELGHRGMLQIIQFGGASNHFGDQALANE